jgi:hypothetical protein
MSKSLASVSLDLDNEWSYLKVRGDAGWESFPSYFDTFIPHVLKALDDLGLKITFFIVGQDAALDKNREYLQEIARRGHEFGNHSFKHESWLHAYTKEQLEEEITLAEECIESATAQRTVGFRGPGFSWSPTLLEVLKARGYRYDASTLPTYIGPIARVYYFWKSDLTKEERATRKGLFGSFQDGFRPLRPYNWKLPSGETLLEIPVTTIPILKTPFHLSYLLYLSGISYRLMDTYLNLAINLCKLKGIQPSFLLHPLDLIGGDQVPRLRFFPGMDIRGERKIELFHHVMEKLGKSFHLMHMSAHADQIADATLAVRTPRIAYSSP